VTRFFILTSGETPEDAIDFIESRGHPILATALTPASSVRLYGVCEVHPPDEPAADT
jgi:hypothetical protein